MVQFIPVGKLLTTRLPAEVWTVAARVCVIFWVGSISCISKLVGSEETELHVTVVGLLGLSCARFAGAVIVMPHTEAAKTKGTSRAEGCISNVTGERKGFDGGLWCALRAT